MEKMIPFSAMEGVRVGNAQDNAAKTGVTVLCFPAGAKTGVDISGGGPASRETPVLDPTKENIGIHAIVFSGGSAYGLAAADGVMQCLEEHGIGYDTGFAKVPLVVQSCIFDLSYGSAKIRPDIKMGYAACMDALHKGKAVSGSFGAVITNGNFDKAELTRIAGQTRNAYARAIKPVGTLADGDAIYAVSCGKPVQADVNMAGTLAAEVMAKAIENAIIASRMEDKEFLPHCLGIAGK